MNPLMWPEDWMTEHVESDVGKALLRRFDDSVENVRERAVALFLTLLQVG